MTDVVPPPATPGKLSALSLRPIVVDAPYVHARSHLSSPGVSIVDARSASFYDGIPRPDGGRGGPQQRLGHVHWREERSVRPDERRQRSS